MRVLKTFLVVGGLLVVASACGHKRDELGADLRSGRWEAVMAAANVPATSPAAVFVRGHSLLLRNRNNEAVCEFLQASPTAVSAYADLARKLVERHPDSPTAYYLLGDSQARGAHWNEAVDSFGRALKLARAFSPALLARGVALVSSGKTVEGARDLYAASLGEPALAEAQAALGWTLLKGGQPAVSVKKRFDAAANLSPGYSLAKAGAGFAEIIGGTPDGGAQVVTAELRTKGCTAVLLVANSVLAAGWAGRSVTDGDGDAPGTQINAGLANRGLIESMKEQNSAVIESAKATAQSAADWTKPGGGALTILNGVKDALDAARPGLDALAGLKGGVKTAFWVDSGLSVADRVLDSQIAQTAIDHERWMNQSKDLGSLGPNGAGFGSSSPGGATANFSRANVDRGRWPFKPVFGLLYPQS